MCRPAGPACACREARSRLGGRAAFRRAFCARRDRCTGMACRRARRRGGPRTRSARCSACCCSRASSPKWSGAADRATLGMSEAALSRSPPGRPDHVFAGDPRGSSTACMSRPFRLLVPPSSMWPILEMWRISANFAIAGKQWPVMLAERRCPIRRTSRRVMRPMRGASRGLAASGHRRRPTGSSTRLRAITAAAAMPNRCGAVKLDREMDDVAGRCSTVGSTPSHRTGLRRLLDGLVCAAIEHRGTPPVLRPRQLLTERRGRPRPLRPGVSGLAEDGGRARGPTHDPMACPSSRRRMSGSGLSAGARGAET